MKKILIYSLVSLLFMVACRKSDNPNVPNNLTRLSVIPLITIESTADQTISAQNPDAFSGKIKIATFYGNTLAPVKFNIVIIKNGDATTVKTLQTGVATVPETLTLTGTQLHTLFGAAIVAGDSFDIGADIIMADGTKYTAFGTTGAPYSTGILSQPGFSPSAKFVCICTFTATDYGAFGVPTAYYPIRDDWADYTDPTQAIPVTVIDATHISFKYAANDAQPIIITIDPATNKTSVASQVIGNYGAPFGDFSVVSVPGNDDVVSPCSLTISVSMHFTESKGGDFGNGTIVLKKK
ncbi:MAG: hypothetical protein ABI203_05350 [Mucilaginibacter sp.]